MPPPYPSRHMKIDLSLALTDRSYEYPSSRRCISARGIQKLVDETTIGGRTYLSCRVDAPLGADTRRRCGPRKIPVAAILLLATRPGTWGEDRRHDHAIDITSACASGKGRAGLLRALQRTGEVPNSPDAKRSNARIFAPGRGIFSKLPKMLSAFTNLLEPIFCSFTKNPNLPCVFAKLLDLLKQIWLKGLFGSAFQSTSFKWLH